MPLLIPVLLGTAAIVGLGFIVKKALANSGPTASQPKTAASLGATLRQSISSGVSSSVTMVPVQLPNGEVWEVTRDYVAGPVGINEATTIVKGLGLELPSPALVDAIWRQADMKLLPQPRNNVISQAVFDDQVKRIEEQKNGRTFTLAAGQFKDVVNNNGHNEIYGWQVEDGKDILFLGTGFKYSKMVTPGPGRNIQPPSGKKHDQPGPVGFKDYSQGARGVRRIA